MVILAVDNLLKTYGPLAAVNRVCFEVRRGEIFAFLGPNLDLAEGRLHRPQLIFPVELLTL